MNIVEFLEARIGEDEVVAQEASAYYNYDDDDPWHFYVEQYAGMQMGEGGYSGTTETPITIHASLWSPTHVLAECAAKRALIATFIEGDYCDDPNEEPCDLCTLYKEQMENRLRIMAQVYATHPQFDPAWQVQR